ncbi:putative late blight resistance protein homolog R1A-10 [Sesamum indicum]|uniref:Late blight resistance protein homolog R1A-10 n=1 Tax=Sesamum indicum TaxID=4182 RepID=A0A6I9SX55_SESIN|nr:putative late blight resistance protein homolog R1A-10 [Sesamum indicum]
MAVSAYAALLSLTHVLDNVQHPTRRHRLLVDINRIQILQEKVNFLRDFLEVHSQGKSQQVEDLARQIVVVADEAEDIIDSHVVDQLRDGSRDQSHATITTSSFCQDIDKVIEKIDLIKKDLMIVKEEWGDVQEQKPVASASVRSSSSGKNTMVGFDEHLLRIIDELTRDESNLQILPIVGMGGIGKTTLARNAFDHPYVVNRFDICIWFTISQVYNVREILLHYLNDGKDEESNESLARLGEKLHKKLFGRRYLIVMDDVWSTKAWDDFSLFFPNNGNGSRVLMTTRLSKVGGSLGTHNPYLMDFLNEEKSWNLLCEKVFGQNDCPYSELEKVGKDIAKGCKGLPIAIVVISGLLARTDMKQERWEHIARNVASFASSKDNRHCLEILSLSYNNLPIHLKPCFLYMSAFPEDSKIKVSRLIKLWVANGYSKPERGKNLEEIAMEYLEDLIDRNLILISERTDGGKIRSCSIHDLLRNLCLRESKKEHLFRVSKTQRIRILPQEKNVCFTCGERASPQESIDVPEILVGSRSTLVASGLVCDTCKRKHQHLDIFRWVKLFGQSCEKLRQHTKLRLIDVRTSVFWYRTLSKFEFVPSSSIPLLWNLQTLLIDGSGANVKKRPIVVPSKVWEMPQLRHIVMDLGFLPTPVDTQDTITLENLQTLSTMHNFRCTKEVFERIPNLKKLKARYLNVKDWSFYCLHNLAHLHRLESLSLIAEDLLLEKTAFPTSLKRLSLSKCRIPWGHITIIGSLLPNLEVLKLLNNAFRGSEWSPVEGQFPRLKVLFISDSDLVSWRADDFHFPHLESLFLRLMHKLEEIPSGIGHIETLRSIHLNKCSELVVNSAKQILEEQSSYGNELEVRVDRKKVSVDDS